MAICIHCEKEPAAPDRVRCQPCLDRNAAAARRYQRRKRVQGLCMACTEPALPGSPRCRRHQRQNAVHARRVRSKRRADGRCQDCGDPLPDRWEYAKCGACLADLQMYHCTGTRTFLR